MRIIAGTLKSRRLAAPDFEGLRPTSDKLRETLFNVIAPRVQGARVLDGFAGTGALGLEALSRGAEHVTFVDDDRRAIALIGENVRRCGVADRCVIIRGRLIEVSRRLEMASFDLILLDPPYAASGAGCRGPRPSTSSGRSERVEGRQRAASWRGPQRAGVRVGVMWEQGPHDPNDAKDLAAVLTATAELLSRDGLVVLEHGRRREAPESAGRLARTRSLTSGDSVLTFYERDPSAGSPTRQPRWGSRRATARAGHPEQVRGDGK